MKRLFKILAVAAVAFTVMTTAGCDADLEFGDKNGNGRPMVIDNIDVEPGAWVKVGFDGFVEYFYADIELPEINDFALSRGTFQTFLKYEEEREGYLVDVQEELPTVRVFNYIDENNYLIPYTENISCSYEEGWMRLKITCSDLHGIRPEETLIFRTVITY